MADFTTGSLVLDFQARDRLFQHYHHENPFVPLTDRLRLVGHTRTERVVDEELAGWLRAYLDFAENEVLAARMSDHNARCNVDEALGHFGREGFIEHAREVMGLTPHGPRDPVHGPCFPPPSRLHPTDTVRPCTRNGRDEPCHHCGSIWVSSGWGGSCCNDCGAFV